MYQVTFQKRNGEIFKRVRKTMLDYRVGEETSMGWKVLDVKYGYKGNWYSSLEYDVLITKAVNKIKLKKRIKGNILSIYKHLVYIVSLLMIVRVFEMTFISVM